MVQHYIKSTYDSYFNHVGNPDMDVDNDDVEEVHSPVDMFIAINHFNLLVRSGCTSEVKRRIQDGYNINFFDVEGFTALHHAVCCGNMYMVNILLENRANFTARTWKGLSVMMLAVLRGRIKIFDIIAEKFASRNPPIPLNARFHVNSLNETLLMLACRAGHFNMVERLLRAGLDPCEVDCSGETSLHHAFSIRETPREEEVVLMLLQSTQNRDFINMKDHDGNTALHKACKVDVDPLGMIPLSTRSAVPLYRKESVETLLDHGASISLTNSKKETALHVAARNKANFLYTLCYAGADSSAQDCKGHTPIHLAILGCRDSSKSIMTIQSMCDSDQGYQPSYFKIRDHEGMTPSLLAFACTNYLAARWSRLPQFYREEVDIDGNTALHWTARIGAVEEVRWLLDNGANMHVSNLKGQTPSNFAEMGSHCSYGCGVCVSLFHRRRRETQQDALGLAMGQHKHIGENSIIRFLSPELVREVANYL
jgi:ankyrin repeat protein